METLTRRNRTLLPCLALVAMPLLACDTGDPDDPAEIGLDAEDLVEALDEDLDDEIDTIMVAVDDDLDERGPELPEWDPEPADELVPDRTPSQIFADWVGGFGGTYSGMDCPYAMTAVGLTVAPSTGGTLVRQIGLICGFEAEVEAGNATLPGGQVVIASGYSNSGFQVNANWNWREAWHASGWNPAPWLRYRAPNTQYFVCDAGYRLNKIDVRDGAYIDRVSGYTCWWDGPGSQGPRGLVYSAPVNIGGWGGSWDNSSCQTTSERFVHGIRCRWGAWLDGFRVNCLE